MALCLAAGLDGIKNNLTPPQNTTKNIFEMSAEELATDGIDYLPGTLEDAMNEFQADPFMKETLGDHIYEKYVEGKLREWDEYRTSVSNWETNRYLTKY